MFAPTDEAILKPENKDKLKAILLHPVVSGDVTAAQVVKLYALVGLAALYQAVAGSRWLEENRGEGGRTSPLLHLG